jgi:DNA mismatch repair protein MutL
LGKYSVAPSLDFNQEPAFDLPLSKLNEIPVQPKIHVNPNYNPFHQDKSEKPSFAGSAFQQASFGRPSASQSDVKAWIESHREEPVQQSLSGTEYRKLSENPVIDLLNLIEDLDDFRFVQTGNGVAVAAHHRGLLVFDIAGARERILYERFLHSFAKQAPHSQQQLFPPQIPLSPVDYLLVTELSDDLRAMGFDIEPFGKNTIVVQGIPSGLEPGSEQVTLQQLLEQYRSNKDKLQLPVHENLARSLARSMVGRTPSQLTSRELRQTAIDLLHCDQPFAGVNGKTILRAYRSEQVAQLLQSNLL